MLRVRWVTLLMMIRYYYNCLLFIIIPPVTDVHVMLKRTECETSLVDKT